MDELTLPDGRRLAYRVSGPDDGPVLVFHHGTPGSAAPVGAVERAAHAAGLRVVVFSRPGYGGSERRVGRDIASDVDHVRAVLDRLQVDRAVSLGWSGGGPHALAAAALLPDRIAGVTSLAGVAPFDVPGLDFLAGMGEDNLREFGAALEGPDALRVFLEQDLEALARVEGPGLAASLASLVPEVDRAVLQGAFADDLAAQMREGLRGGVSGWLDDDLAFLTPWGFDLDRIAVPVHLWQGTADLMVPLAHGRWLAGAVPGATVHLEDGEGHFSLTSGRADAVIGELAALL